MSNKLDDSFLKGLRFSKEIQFSRGMKSQGISQRANYLVDLASALK
jgi:hypothetical protein